MTLAIILHLNDLRIEQNPAVSGASKCDRLLAVYQYDQERENLGAASRWWLHHSLHSLKNDYHKKGADLYLGQGDLLTSLPMLAKKVGATHVFWNWRWDPTYFDLLEKLQKALERAGIEVVTSNGSYLLDPRTLETKSGKPYAVFTPFYKAALKAIEVQSVAKIPSKFRSVKAKSLTVEELKLLEKHPWTKKLERAWKPGRGEAKAKLKRFLKNGASRYDKDRDFPAIDGTSTLSPHLHFGEISPHEVYLASLKKEPFVRQLFWREFANYFLFHFPGAAKKNWNPKFDRFPWINKRAELKKWQQGRTGYPIVDAGMRQLWKTGWMHNRVRMIVASFLTKDLLIDWRKGEGWFWDTLVDADRGNNVLGWQWTAGSGPDAAPYFRVFNPILQGKKFDPTGSYIREYLPELKNLPDRWIHEPWNAPEEVLDEAALILEKDYPMPIVDHAQARTRALKSFAQVSK